MQKSPCGLRVFRYTLGMSKPAITSTSAPIVAQNATDKAREAVARIIARNEALKSANRTRYRGGRDIS